MRWWQLDLSRGTVLLSAVGLLMAGAGFGVHDLDGWAGWVIRASAVAYWGAVTVALARRDGYPAVVSPLYLLGSSALWAYVVIPAAYVAAGGAVYSLPVPQAVASAGALAVCRFALVLLAAAPLACVIRRPGGGDLPRWPAAFSAGLAVCGLLVGARVLLAAPQAAALASLAAPAILACIAVQVIAARQGQPRGTLLAWALIGGAAPALLPDCAKIYFIMVVLAGIVTALPGRTGRRSLAAIPLLGVVAVCFMAFYAARFQHFRGSLDVGKLEGVLAAKLVFRQAETLNCLTSVVDERGQPHAEPGFHLGPLYFVEAVVPRAVWPDKPSLSRGHDFALTYCGFPPEQVNGNETHSASVALIGEPLVQAGASGLVTFTIVVVAALGALSRLWIRGGWPAAAVLASMPWLVDFDQSAALYVGNAVKFGLVATMAVLVLALIGGRRARHR